MTEPGRLLELVRERITASVVLQRHVPIAGKRGVRVIARRRAAGSRELSWLFEYDEGIDPDRPVRRPRGARGARRGARTRSARADLREARQRFLHPLRRLLVLRAATDPL